MILKEEIRRVLKVQFCSPGSTPGRPAQRNHSCSSWVGSQAFPRVWKMGLQPFGSPYSAQAKASSCSLLLPHPPWVRLGSRVSSSKAQVNFHQCFQQWHAQPLWNICSDQISVATDVSTTVFRSWGKCGLAQFLDGSTSTNIIYLKGMCFLSMISY